MEINDRLSNLPDRVFYNILALLPLKDTACVGVLSKKIRNRCFSSSSLTFDLYEYRDDHIRSYFMKFLDAVMVLRNEKDIKCFRVRWFFYKPNSGEQLVVDGWLQSAARCNVQELNLDIMPEEGKAFAIPHCLHGCRSLRVLEMDLHKRILEMPAMGFVSLRVLSLKSVQISCESFEKVISSCHLLKKLHLEDLFGIAKITINSYSLQEFTFLKSTIDDLHHLKLSAKSLRSVTLSWYFCSPTEKSFELCAPNLKVFKWRGDTVNYFDIGYFLSLESASFNLRPPVLMNEGLKDCLVKLICSVRGVKGLQLNCWHIEVFKEDCQPDRLSDLHDLVLNVSDLKEDHQVSAILSFLLLLPNLQALTIKNCLQPWVKDLNNSMGLEASSYDTDGWKSQNQLSRLELVEIELTGGDNELQLVKFLLKNLKQLKKMTILYSLLDIHRLPKIAKEIPKFEKASSKVVIYFVPYL